MALNYVGACTLFIVLKHLVLPQVIGSARRDGSNGKCGCRALPTQCLSSACYQWVVKETNSTIYHTL